jgi:hypothetical protein
MMAYTDHSGLQQQPDLSQTNPRISSSFLNRLTTRPRFLNPFGSADIRLAAYKLAEFWSLLRRLGERKLSSYWGTVQELEIYVVRRETGKE